MPKFLNKKRAVVAGVAVVALGGGMAYAYWTNSGSGTGSASTGTNTSVTVNQTSASNVALYPGGPVQPLSGNFDNPNAGSVYVTQVSVAVKTGWSSQADPAKPACTASDFDIVQPTPTNAEIPAGTGVGSWSGASIALHNYNANQDNCKNVSVDLTYTSS